MDSHEATSLAPGTSQIIRQNRSGKRKNPPQQIRRKYLVPDDDPPKSLPDFYRSPAHLVEDGDEIEVWWEGDNKFYPAKARNLRNDGKRRIEYEDGQVMYHDLKKELFILSGHSLERFLAGRFPTAIEDHLDDHPVRYPGLASLLVMGDSVEVYWPEYKTFYNGRVTGKGPHDWCSIKYEDGDSEGLNMGEETFRFLGMSAARAYSTLI